jgi:hypothetical protein
MRRLVAMSQVRSLALMVAVTVVVAAAVMVMMLAKSQISSVQER